MLVTGASSGIGFAAAERFLREGAQLVVAASTQVGAEEAARRLGHGTIGIGANATSLSEQQNLAARVAERFTRIDVAFLNAGIADFRPFGDHDERSYDQLFDVNVKGLYFLVQALEPVFADGASVVVTSSNVAHGAHAYANLYAATKAATSSLVASWNAELMPTRRIRFNAVSPGPIDTPCTTSRGLPSPDSRPRNRH